MPHLDHELERVVQRPATQTRCQPADDPRHARLRRSGGVGWIPPLAEGRPETTHDRAQIDTKPVSRSSESIPGSRDVRHGP